jgi:hypothetical protein
MASSLNPALTPERRSSLQALASDLRRVFGQRLYSVVAYDAAPGPAEELYTLALVASLTFEDLASCASAADHWQRLGLAVPLILSRDEFSRSLDVFPLEYGEIIARHLVIVGDNPFDGVSVAETDLRRACEQHAKSHLIHLREGFLEAGKHSRELTDLIVSSAPAFRILLGHIARLDGGLTEPEADDADLAAFISARIGVSEELLNEVLSSPRTLGSIPDPTPLLARYIAASERIWEYVDAWRER